MRIDGEWYVCDDNIVRPAILARIGAANGSFVETFFLIDTGADKTVLDAATFRAAGFRAGSSLTHLGGLGGSAEAVTVETTLNLARDGGGEVAFRGRYHALIDHRALDMPVLGRDILDLFTLIVDRPGNVVCLISQRHRYQIVET